MLIAQDLEQANLEMEADVLLGEFFQINKNQTEKVKYGIIYFLEQAKINHFRVFKTHLLQFYALCEWYYAQSYSNLLFGWEYIASHEGPIPLPLVEIFNLMQKPNQYWEVREKEMIESLPFNLKKIVDQKEQVLRTQILLKTDLVFNDFYFSNLDLMVMKKVTMKIFTDLKTTENITHYFRCHSQSWKQVKKNNHNKIKQPKIINFAFDFPSFD